MMALPEPAPKHISASYCAYSHTKFETLNNVNSKLLSMQFRRIEGFINFSSIEMRIKFRDGLCLTLPAWSDKQSRAAHGTNLLGRILEQQQYQRIVCFNACDLNFNGLNDLQVRVDRPETEITSDLDDLKYQSLAEALGIPINEPQYGELARKHNTSDPFDRLKGVGEKLTGVTRMEVMDSPRGLYVDDWDAVIWIPNPASGVYIQDCDIRHPFGVSERQQIIEDLFSTESMGVTDVGYEYVCKRPIHEALWLVHGRKVYRIRNNICSNLADGIYLYSTNLEYTKPEDAKHIEHYSVDDALKLLPVYGSYKDAEEAVRLMPNLKTQQEKIATAGADYQKEIRKLSDELDKAKFELHKAKYDMYSTDTKEEIIKETRAHTDRKEARARTYDFIKNFPVLVGSVSATIALLFKFLKFVFVK